MVTWTDLRAILNIRGDNNRRTNMKTLKTISVILPMTLLLACGGGGGGGYSALPTGSNPQEIEPTLNPTAITLTADSGSFVVDDVDADDNDTESYTVSVEATSIEVAPRSQTVTRYEDGPYKYQQFGKWFHTVRSTDRDNNLFFMYGKWTKNDKWKGWHHGGDHLETQIQGNNEFAGAVYTGKSIVKRKRSHGGGIREGDARINVNSDFTVDFFFSNIEGIADLSYEGATFESSRGPGHKAPLDTVETPDLKIKRNGKIKEGVSATFYGENGEAVGGLFRDIDEGVKRGVFGAVRDTVEIK